MNLLWDKCISKFEVVGVRYSVEWLIIDESDKLFEAGETGFRDQVW